MQVLLQPAFILHSRPYRETSALIEVITAEYGRITLVARGMRSRRASMQRSLLQPFVPVLLTWQGKTELMTMLAVEAQGAPFLLRGNCLLSGFYLNELLIRLLPKHDPCPRLFAVYFETLHSLHTGLLKEMCLRIFEKKLLEELGYALQLQYDFSGRLLKSEAYYQFHPGQGFKIVVGPHLKSYFKGASLIALATEQLDQADYLCDIKNLMRIVIGNLLGPQGLYSRELFISSLQSDTN